MKKVTKKSKGPKYQIEKIIISGKSGQGNLLIGRLLSYCAMKLGFEVSFIPGFGFENGEGNSQATIIISENPIGSPMVYVPDVLVACNTYSYEHLAPKVKAGGLILANGNSISRKDYRDDIVIIDIPAQDLARELGSDQVANMVLCGAYIARSQMIHLQDLFSVLEDFFKELRQYKLQKINLKAIELGYNYVKEKKYMHARFLHSLLNPGD